MTSIYATAELTTVTCWCGVMHAIPESLNAQAHNKGTSVYCPLGHVWVYTETNEQKLKKAQARLAEEQRRTQAARDLLAQEERSHAATRGQVTKLKKRAANGVCACCNRTFQNLAHHMATKHPELASEGPRLSKLKNDEQLPQGIVHCKIIGCENLAKQRGRYAYLCGEHRARYGS